MHKKKSKRKKAKKLPPTTQNSSFLDKAFAIENEAKKFLENELKNFIANYQNEIQIIRKKIHNSSNNIATAKEKGLEYLPQLNRFFLQVCILEKTIQDVMTETETLNYPLSQELNLINLYGFFHHFYSSIYILFDKDQGFNYWKICYELLSIAYSKHQDEIHKNAETELYVAHGLINYTGELLHNATLKPIPKNLEKLSKFLSSLELFADQCQNTELKLQCYMILIINHSGIIVRSFLDNKMMQENDIIFSINKKISETNSTRSADRDLYILFQYAANFYCNVYYQKLKIHSGEIKKTLDNFNLKMLSNSTPINKKDLSKMLILLNKYINSSNIQEAINSLTSIAKSSQDETFSTDKIFQRSQIILKTMALYENSFLNCIDIIKVIQEELYQKNEKWKLNYGALNLKKLCLKFNLQLYEIALSYEHNMGSLVEKATNELMATEIELSKLNDQLQDREKNFKELIATEDQLNASKANKKLLKKINKENNIRRAFIKNKTRGVKNNPKTKSTGNTVQPQSQFFKEAMTLFKNGQLKEAATLFLRVEPNQNGLPIKIFIKSQIHLGDIFKKLPNDTLNEKEQKRADLQNQALIYYRKAFESAEQAVQQSNEDCEQKNIKL